MMQKLFRVRREKIWKFVGFQKMKGFLNFKGWKWDPLCLDIEFYGFFTMTSPSWSLHSKWGFCRFSAAFACQN